MESFENDWKDILGNATDSSFKPDIARVWSKVSAAQKKERKIVPWVTHLAAILVGVLIALSFLLPHKKTQQNIVEIIRTPNIPKVVHDTVQQTIVVTSEPKPKEDIRKPYLGKHNYSPKEVNTSRPSVADVKRANLKENEPAVAKTTPNVTTGNTMVKAELVATQQHIVRPVYLSDIEENASIPAKMNVIQKMIDAKFAAITYTESPNPLSFFRSFSNNK